VNSVAQTDIQFAENPGKRADVVFVAVGKHDAAHMLAIFERYRCRDDDVHAQHSAFGEHQPASTDNDDVSPLCGWP